MNNIYSIDKLFTVYKQLETYKAPDNQSYIVYAYFLYASEKNGTIGKQIYLGAYSTNKKATMIANNLIERSGYEYIFVTKACQWTDIEYVNKSNTTVSSSRVSDPLTEKISEISLNDDTDNIERYTKLWGNIIKDTAASIYHQQKLDYYNKRIGIYKCQIRLYDDTSPDLKNIWLPHYKQRLIHTNQYDLYIMLEEGYKSFKDKIY